MLLNYFKTALRHFLRFKGYTFLNISGLTVGLAAGVLILLWVADEVSMDKFHSKSDRIFMIWRNMYQANGEINTTPATPQPMELVLENDYPEVDQVTLLSWQNNLLFQYDKITFRESGRFVSPEFLDIFSFPLILGDPETALDEIQSVIISESLALKYFGKDWKEDDSSLGQILRIDDREEFLVTGVFKDPANNSSLDFDWLIPAQAYIKDNSWVESWYNGGFRILFTTKEGVDPVALGQKIEQEVNKNTNYEADERLVLQIFTDQYLHSNWENGVPSGGRIDYVRILFVVSIFILIIACVNFMNLATARASRRTQEVGIRKVMGARKGSLSLQFLTESILISAISVALSVLAVVLLLPFFNELTGKSMFIDFANRQTWIFLVSVTLLTGFVSGSYPAMLLPSFRIDTALKGGMKHSRFATFFRKGLVVFQFVISILLIIGTFVIYRQIEFIMNKNLGLDKENLVSVQRDGQNPERFESYKTELLKIPEVKNVTSMYGSPINYGSSTGGADWEGKNPDDVVEINVMSVSHEFFETMGMEITMGRPFSRDYKDSARFIINEVAAEIMGFDDPIGKRLSVWGEDGQIVGVVRDFHMDSMYEPIQPLIVRFDPPGGNFSAYVRIQGNTQDALLALEKVTTTLDPDNPFSYSFIDEEYAQSYRSEITLSTLARIFAAVSLIISCLGLFGLSSYSAEQRSREIGIRKVHGASVVQIVSMLNQDYTRLILLAFLIATPMAYYVMENWLGNFTFRTNLGAALFIISGIGALAIGTFTVSFKSFQAASVNPVKTLKDE